MIEYIINERLKTIIYRNNTTEISDKSMVFVIKTLCYDHLLSYEGYKKAVKTKLGYYYKIPLYLDMQTQLIPIKRIKDFDNIWINLPAIKDIKNNDTFVCINFYSGKTLHLKIEYKTLIKQIEQLNQIRIFVSKHFHF
ncbi:MAG: competence protein ComK [Acholeplasmataceae bacterium]